MHFRSCFCTCFGVNLVSWSFQFVSRKILNPFKSCASGTSNHINSSSIWNMWIRVNFPKLKIIVRARRVSPFLFCLRKFYKGSFIPKLHLFAFNNFFTLFFIRLSSWQSRFGRRFRFSLRTCFDSKAFLSVSVECFLSRSFIWLSIYCLPVWFLLFPVLFMLRKITLWCYWVLLSLTTQCFRRGHFSQTLD